MCCNAMTNLKRDWSDRKKWIFVDVGKYALCFSRTPRGKVWNLIKPFSGGAALIRDSLNKQQVPQENKIYMLQHEPSLHLTFCFCSKRAVVLETAEPFQFQPQATFSSQRSVSVCQKYFQWSLPSSAFSVKLPRCKLEENAFMLMSSYVFVLYFKQQICGIKVLFIWCKWCQKMCLSWGYKN